MDFLGFISQWRWFTKAYGIQWLCLSLIFPSLPEFVQDIERHVLDRTEESVSEFRNKQVAILSNTGTTAAILSQVTVTSLQLNAVETVHWSTRGFFYFSLFSSLLSVLLSFLKHRDIISLDNSGLRSRLGVHKRFRLFQKKRLNMTVVVALYLPYTSLNAAIISYMMAMSTYLTARGTGTDWVTDLDNTKILLVFNSALFIGGIAYMCTKLTGIKFTTSKSEQNRNVLHVGNILQTEAGRMQQSNLASSNTPPQARGQTVIEMTTQSPNIALLKVLAEAAAAHKAAAAASEAVAAHYERMSSNLQIQPEEWNSSPTAEAAISTDVYRDSTTSAV